MTYSTLRRIRAKQRERHVLDAIACGLILASAMPITFGIVGVALATQWHFETGYVMPDADAIAVTVAMAVGSFLLVGSAVVAIVNTARNG